MLHFNPQNELLTVGVCSLCVCLPPGNRVHSAGLSQERPGSSAGQLAASRLALAPQLTHFIPLMFKLRSSMTNTCEQVVSGESECHQSGVTVSNHRFSGCLSSSLNLWVFFSLLVTLVSSGASFQCQHNVRQSGSNRGSNRGPLLPSLCVQAPVVKAVKRVFKTTKLL